LNTVFTKHSKPAHTGIMKRVEDHVPNAATMIGQMPDGLNGLTRNLV
jgi:hypothetical protein